VLMTIALGLAFYLALIADMIVITATLTILLALLGVQT
jgi:hypothetical protein